MEKFQNILVGVDLSQGDWLVGGDLSVPNAECVRRASWLAKRNGARLLFFCAIDISPQAEYLIEQNRSLEKNVQQQAADALARLVARASDQGIEAASRVTLGKSWVEIIRQVIRGGHDLVVAGTRHLGPVKSMLFGSTSMKLLRKCPCPVWVTQPQTEGPIHSILVAHDLGPVGDRAMELGGSMAALNDAELHVLHAMDFPELNYLLPEADFAVEAAKYRARAERHIAGQLAGFNLPQPAEVHILSEPADFAILNLIERCEIELLVMGTVGRAGIPGLITGNTAERLLPRIPCSVLAVKPAGFKSPVTLD